MKRLAVVGSRDLTEAQKGVASQLVWWAVDSYAHRFPDLHTVSGGASGIDSVVRDVSVFRLGDDRHIEHKPKVFRWSGKGGFEERNKIIALECDWIICIQSRQSKTYGSGWTYEYALTIGKVEGKTAWRYWV